MVEDCRDQAAERGWQSALTALLVGGSRREFVILSDLMMNRSGFMVSVVISGESILGACQTWRFRGKLPGRMYRF